MAIKNSKRFAEVEFCMQHYFNNNFAPIMKTVQADLDKKQTEEMVKYQTSALGIMSSIAMGADGNFAATSQQTLKNAGTWTTKTAEDYVAMCKKEFQRSPNLRDDMVCFADEWRKTVVKEIGREKYDELSKKMGCDLAFAYVDYRMNQMMINYMAKKNVPKSSIQYIVNKGMQGSLIGMIAALSKSPLQKEIDKTSEKAYQPNKAEKFAGKAASVATDVVTTGGVSSWGAVGKWAAADIVFSGAECYYDKKHKKPETKTVEQCISQGVFGSTTNVFDTFRQQSKGIKSANDNYVLTLNRQLKNDIEHNLPQPQKPLPSPPLKGREQKSETIQAGETLGSSVRPQSTESPVLQEGVGEGSPTNESGWQYLLSSLGLNNLSDIGANLGYVIAMLPDMLLGMFTGKTQSVGVKKDIIPIASVVLGMVVKNPLLKMSLIGMGGANLINKVGHEAIEREEAKVQQFKHYSDEPLNSRITNPTLNGNTLVATIDRVPCSITLPESAVAAYNSGALPLNTLANAVLAKSDTMHGLAQTNYQNVEMNRVNDRQITLK